VNCKGIGTNQMPKPLSIVKSISNKERGGTHEKNA
jgi:hypothetical protein